jgi:hypothetical protein
MRGYVCDMYVRVWVSVRVGVFVREKARERQVVHECVRPRLWVKAASYMPDVDHSRPPFRINVRQPLPLHGPLANLPFPSHSFCITPGPCLTTATQEYTLNYTTNSCCATPVNNHCSETIG